jgi:hypothetical protein
MNKSPLNKRQLSEEENKENEAEESGSENDYDPDSMDGDSDDQCQKEVNDYLSHVEGRLNEVGQLNMTITPSEMREWLAAMERLKEEVKKREKKIAPHQLITTASGMELPRWVAEQHELARITKRVNELNFNPNLSNSEFKEEEILKSLPHEIRQGLSKLEQHILKQDVSEDGHDSDHDSVFRSSFKESKTFEERKAESDKLKERYPDRVPIICEKSKTCTLPDIDKTKYLVGFKSAASCVLST